MGSLLRTESVTLPAVGDGGLSGFCPRDLGRYRMLKDENGPSADPAAYDRPVAIRWGTG